MPGERSLSEEREERECSEAEGDGSNQDLERMWERRRKQSRWDGIGERELDSRRQDKWDEWEESRKVLLDLMWVLK